ncbi:siderophore-interacting protein [Lipingzhangella sp. LS1_29]|uniref:Siderophore-interacting protein n=1 Tax=Lipingzhangella rawalii TaxID=2055835 RepID=A0ABU2H2M0_9ACTN|nr:siderophore-interacting protein [Lipingzhangella rawalii]MDS1269115.1 siderophore-interacting protein [Lipingzhangella rawalii]
MSVASSRVELYPVQARQLSVRTAHRLTPRMIRIVLTGAELSGFRTDNHDDHVKLFFPDENTGQLWLPQPDAEGHWNFRDPNLTFRDYTVRHYAPERAELTIDFVAHDHGPAGRWALHATPGDRIGVLGPRGTRHLDRTADYYLIVADETGLPAAARLLEELPAHSTALAFLEVAAPSEEQTITTAATTHITWLSRDGAPAGSSSLLHQALRTTPLPPGTGIAWCAGEALTLKPLRRILKEQGFVRGHNAEIDGYWRRGANNRDHHLAAEAA